LECASSRGEHTTRIGVVGFSLKAPASDGWAGGARSGAPRRGLGRPARGLECWARRWRLGRPARGLACGAGGGLECASSRDEHTTRIRVVGFSLKAPASDGWAGGARSRAPRWRLRGPARGLGCWPKRWARRWRRRRRARVCKEQNCDEQQMESSHLVRLQWATGLSEGPGRGRVQAGGEVGASRRRGKGLWWFHTCGQTEVSFGGARGEKRETESDLACKNLVKHLFKHRQKGANSGACPCTARWTHWVSRWLGFEKMGC
jgi:hypothetical protein